VPTSHRVSPSASIPSACAAGGGRRAGRFGRLEEERLQSDLRRRRRGEQIALRVRVSPDDDLDRRAETCIGRGEIAGRVDAKRRERQPHLARRGQYERTVRWLRGADGSERRMMLERERHDQPILRHVALGLVEEPIPGEIAGQRLDRDRDAHSGDRRIEDTRFAREPGDPLAIGADGDALLNGVEVGLELGHRRSGEQGLGIAEPRLLEHDRRRFRLGHVDEAVQRTGLVPPREVDRQHRRAGLRRIRGLPVRAPAREIGETYTEFIAPATAAGRRRLRPGRTPARARAVTRARR
jgi:hypothetical protein